ncbi:MAG TPA: hypothetical protein VFQ44_17225 [Streptosporangiaceae bacterium]|nr:hypothetical protein [Streptosporangiaceae bacterium]
MPAIPRFRRTVLAALVFGASALAVGCSGSGEHTVFAIATDFGEGDRAVRTIDIIDVGVPSLYNVTDQSVRVRKVALASAPPAVRLLGATAHPGQAVGIVFGDLSSRCAKEYPAHPVTDALIRPRSRSNWFLVLAIRFSKPGRYYLGRVKIYYTTGGQDGWQYQNLHATFWVHAARPGTKPRFQGCP